MGQGKYSAFFGWVVACFRESGSFGLPCVSFVDVCQFACVLFPFGVRVECGIVLVPDHRLSFYTLSK